MKNIDIEEKWKENVDKAKQIASSRSYNQMQIAALALEVCEVSWGGAGSKNLYTIKRFASEIKVRPNLLSQWMAVRLKVYNKIPKEQSAKLSYNHMAVVAAKIKKDTPIKEIQAQIDSYRSVDVCFKSYLYNLRTMANAFNLRNASEKLDDDYLSETVFYCNSILKIIKKEKPNIKPKDCGVASLTSYERLTIASAIDVEGRSFTIAKDKDGLDVKITQSDIAVAKFMRQNKDKFFSPTEVGQKIHKKPAKASCVWASKRLTKLASIGQVERNNIGHYKWIGEV